MLQLSLVSVHLFSLKNLSTLGTKTARKLRHKFHNNGQVCLQLVDHYGWNCNSVKNSEWHFFIFILINFTSRRQLYQQPFEPNLSLHIWRRCVEPQPFFSVRYLHTRKRRETYKRKARKAKKNPNQVLCQARLPNNGLMAVELVWINCFGHRWPIGLHSRHPMAPPQIPWWFIGPCSSVEWVSQQNRYGTYSLQVKGYW